MSDVMVLSTQDLKLAIIGLGYVGLPLAVEFGKKRNVIGFDINQRRIDELLAGEDSTLEMTHADGIRLCSPLVKEFVIGG